MSRASLVRSCRRSGPLALVAPLFALLAVLLLGCQPVLEQVGVALFYVPATLPEGQTQLDLAYRSDPGADPEKHRLDLFLPDPSRRDWPTLVFVHGGGWTHGDRAVEAAGASVMRNIGRHFASRGVGAAVISYRLQPAVDWHDQLADVTAALRFVREQVPAHGGHPDAIYLSGHSAGAWLAARAGFDAALLEAGGVPQASLCGVVLVSGGGYDLADERTYALGASRDYFVARFDDGAEDWERRGSVVPLLRPDLPPALILYGTAEPRKLTRQSELLFDAMQASGARVSRIVLPRQTHQSIVMTLSRGDATSVPAILDLMRRTDCPAGP